VVRAARGQGLERRVIEVPHRLALELGHLAHASTHDWFKLRGAPKHQRWKEGLVMGPETEVVVTLPARIESRHARSERLETPPPSSIMSRQVSRESMAPVLARLGRFFRSCQPPDGSPSLLERFSSHDCRLRQGARGGDVNWSVS
jgi:hypothetical protein